MFQFDPRILTDRKFHELLAPGLPGGIVLTGMLLRKPEYLDMIFKANNFGYHTKLFALLLVAYALGGLIIGFLALVDMLLALPALTLLSKSQLRPAEDALWRTVVSRFLGTALSPKTLDTHSFRSVVLQTKNAAGTATAADANWAIDAAVSDTEWNRIYDVLQIYLDRVPKINNEALTALVLLHSGFFAAFAFLLIVPQHFHWLIWSAAIFTNIAIPLLMGGLVWSNYIPAQFANVQTAMILRLLQQPSSASSQVKSAAQS